MPREGDAAERISLLQDGPVRPHHQHQQHQHGGERRRSGWWCSSGQLATLVGVAGGALLLLVLALTAGGDGVVAPLAPTRRDWVGAAALLGDGTLATMDAAEDDLGNTVPKWIKVAQR